MPDKNENLEELFGAFIGETDAAEAAEDVRSGLELFEQFSAPEPSEQVLAAINAEISRKLAKRRTSGVRWMRRSAVAAVAMILIGVAVTVFMPDSNRIESFDGSIWVQGEPVAVSTINAEMDDLLERMITISRQEYSFADAEPDFYETELDDIEMIATNDDFWKD